MARRAKKTTWQKVAEKSTKARAAPDEKEAKRIFREELTRADQNALVREVALTRGAELCRAYRNVVLVGYGVRLRRRKRSGAAALTDTPCVTLVVKQKWDGKTAPPTKDEKLPDHLLAYWTVDGRRKLCAVPTDVAEAADYADASLQASAQHIRVDQGLGGSIPLGVLACAVRRSTHSEKIFAMSCRHVFSADDSKTSRSVIELESNGRQVGITRAVLGKLERGVLFSLDAQLAEVTDLSGLALALGECRLTGIAKPGDGIPSSCFVLTARGPIEVQQGKILLNQPLPYSGGDRIVHDELIATRFVSQKTQKGDSGSALVSARDGGTFLGMHIAGDAEHAYAIPAWDLFTPGLYSGASRIESWSLVQPEEIAEALQQGSNASAPTLAADDAEPAGQAALPPWLRPLTLKHNTHGSVRWRLSKAGLHIENNAPQGTAGAPLTVERVWMEQGDAIRRFASQYDVPVELIIATICTESSGNPDAVREEPGYISDERTPDKVSVGLMQTLISTAREALGGRKVNRSDLKRPETSIEAGTAYIAQQRSKTGMDPPKVACAYNAGGVYPNDGSANRWKMKQYPIDSGDHADRFVKWFNDCFRFFKRSGQSPTPSFYRFLGNNQ